MANRKKTIYLGWDVGGTKSAAVVGSAEGTILDRQEWPSNAPAGPKAMLADFLVHAQAMIAAHKGVAMVGVSVGGPLNTLTGEVLAATFGIHLGLADLHAMPKLPTQACTCPEHQQEHRHG